LKKTSTAYRYVLAVLLTLAASIAVMNGMDLRLIGVDDANILFVYSKHFAAGEGLVYNIGEERVEGFSSMLWMLITSIGYLITEQPTKLFFALNVLLVGTAIGFTWQYIDTSLLNASDSESTEKTHLTSAGALLWLAWIASNPGFFIWTVTSLMETGLWAALLLTTVTLLLYAISDERTTQSRLYGFASLNVLMLLTRPEAMAWVLYFLAMLLIVLRWQENSFKSALRRWLPIVAVCAVSLAALIIFRLNYFGYPLPNTYYAKMTPDKLYDIKFGLLYLRQFLTMNWLAAIPILLSIGIVGRYMPAIVLTLIHGPKRIDRNELAGFCAASAALVGILLPVLMGGDIFGAFRFYQPVWPLLLIPVLLITRTFRVTQLNSTQARVLTGTVVALVAFTLTQGISWTNLSADRGRVGHLYELTHRGILSGQYIQEIFSSSTSADLPTLGASAAGGYKMGYPGTVIDTMGLNFTPMAHHDGDKKGERGHASFSKEIFWQYPVDLLEPTLCPASKPPVNKYLNPGNWVFEIYQRLFTDRAFKQKYRFVAIEAPQAQGWLCTYINRDTLETLTAQKRHKIVLID
jgi:hypothetical protein